VNTDTKPAAGAPVGEKDRTDPLSPGRGDGMAMRTEKNTITVKPKAASPSKSSKTARRLPQSLRTGSKAEKVVCRYCGSDDLAPSFIKRRDARCRACFKQRYGSAKRSKQPARARRAKGRKVILGTKRI
jgi:hypothetical protein